VFGIALAAIYGAWGNDDHEDDDED
jgi:hypothetical protein